MIICDVRFRDEQGVGEVLAHFKEMGYSHKLTKRVRQGKTFLSTYKLTRSRGHIHAK